VPSSIVAAPVRQQGDEDAGVAVTVPPFVFVGNGVASAAARMPGGGEIWREGGGKTRRRRDLERGRRKDEAREWGRRSGGSLIHVGTRAVWSAYENTWPDSGPDVAAGVEKGKIV
jgi:hypothetical protein